MLLRRRRKIEGEKAEVARKSVVKEQAHVAPLDLSTPWLRRTSGSSDEGHSPNRHAPLGQRRRVRVPSWVHDGPEPATEHQRVTPSTQAQTAWNFMRQGSCASCDSAKSAPPVPTRSASQELRRKLRRAQRERDHALRAAVAAEAGESERSVELEAEAMRLRETAAALRSELAAARDEVAQRRREAALHAPAGHGGEAASSSSGQRAVALAESQALAEELCGQANERSALQVRLSSLAAELDRQAACERHLREELQLRRGNEESLKRRLEALSTKRAASQHISRVEEAPPTDGDASPARTAPSASAGSSALRGTPQALPPPDARFDLADGSPEHAEEEEHAQAAAADLEFAYDWGLDLSSRMSVSRALELARWAAQTSASASAQASDPGEGFSRQATTMSAHSEDIYEGPLADLQRALEVLSGAAARRAAEAPATGSDAQEDAEDTSAFDGPIANLQAALLWMGQSQEPQQTPELAEEDPVEEEQEGTSLEAFELEVQNLQQALRRMSSKHGEHLEETSPEEVAQHFSPAHSIGPEQPASTEVDELDAFAAPMAELQQALAKLGVADGSHGEAAEAGAATPATAPSSSSAEASASPVFPVTPARKHSSDTEGSSASASAAPATLLGAFGALDPTQAFLRRKYSVGNPRHSL